MKASRWMFLMLAWILPPFLNASTSSEVFVGDAKAQVLETLGEPKGWIGSPEFEIYYFARGEVVFAEGIVQSHSLISEEAFAARQREAEARRLAEIQREKEARARRHAEGLALREKAQSDPVFATLPAEDQLAFWRSFRSKYPEIDVELEYLIAYRQAEAAREAEAIRLAEARQQAETAARIRELEERVEEAEREAERAQARSYYAHDYYYRDPVVIIRHRDNDRDDDHKRDHDRDRGRDRDWDRDHDHKKPKDSDWPTNHDSPRSQVTAREEARQKAMGYMTAARQGVFHSNGVLRQEAERERMERMNGSIYLR